MPDFKGPISLLSKMDPFQKDPVPLYSVPLHIDYYIDDLYQGDWHSKGVTWGLVHNSYKSHFNDDWSDYKFIEVLQKTFQFELRVTWPSDGRHDPKYELLPK